MTEWKMEQLLARLERKLGLEEPDEDVLVTLSDELRDAENELKLYLNRQELPCLMESKIVELAAVFFQRDCNGTGGVSSSSYSEGQISQNDRFFSPKEYRAAVAEILESVARYRRVVC